MAAMLMGMGMTVIMTAMKVSGGLAGYTSFFL